MPLWTEPSSPRLWRATPSDFLHDEVGSAAEVYTDAALARLAEEGFTGIWLGGVLYDVMRSQVFPELNRPGAEERIAELHTLIARAARHGLGVWLYFNEPVGIDIDHPFWQAHPDLRGVEKWHMYSLCTSTPEVQAFFRDAVESVFERLHGLAGVFLITACESLTHCWSKSATRRGQPPPTCPRCREREPADLVLELLSVWAEVSRAQPQPFRVLAWNWEWAYWYDDPQAPIVDRLPEGVESLVDLEIGGTRLWHGRPNCIGEYSLSYAGPSQRFVATRDAVAGRALPVHAKIQINSTHELCTVPNVPVLATLHEKFAALVKHEVAGFLGCWTIGTQFTLNTYALRLFLRDPQRFLDRRTFLAALAQEYFGLENTEGVIRAWEGFSEAFTHYPFSVRVLYFGPHNDAPARRLSLHYEGQPLGRSFMDDPPGDDLSTCLAAHHADLESFTLEEVIEGFTALCEGWERALRDYEAALQGGSASREGEIARRRREELGCARMIALQMRSTLNAFRFFRQQQRVMRKYRLTPPCDLPPEEPLLQIMAEEVANARRALPLVAADPRLGFHEEFHGYKYSAAKIEAKVAAMEDELGRRGGREPTATSNCSTS